VTVTLFHSHGIGHFDYSSLKPNDLKEINDLARERDLLLCPTVFLRREYLSQFIEVMAEYSDLNQTDGLSNILGFSIEGPLLGVDGGVPRSACWRPSIEEWHTIISLASHGLRYLVMAPDAMDIDEVIDDGYTFRGLLRDCYDNGLRVALGHFRRDNPSRSAATIDAVLSYLHQRYESSPYLVLTDHLFNDMPRIFIHAWRTGEERRRRDAELTAFLDIPWESAKLADILGPVPAVLLQAARNNLLTPAINFDGFHVDLQICRRTVDYVGGGRLIAMTDDTELNLLAGEILYQTGSNPLRYRSDNVIAAGSSNCREQMANMTSIGISREDITSMFGTTPEAALRYAPRLRPGVGEQTGL
jgi:N-acetylglucosamine-6-phosphate deacetylase